MEVATVDCYTCRRRRVRCDRRLPHCEKCTVRRELECLGYTKPLVWTKGIASRGKMMGKTFPMPNNNVVAPAAATAAGGSASSSSSSGGSGDVLGVTLCMETAGAGGSASGWLRPFNPEFFGALDETSKYYLSYFDKRVCCDLMLFERYGDNPYRSLLPLAAHSPSLLNAALAVSARHCSNSAGFPETHALAYRGRAMKSLWRDLQCNGPKVVMQEPVFAAILLFLFFEVLEGGRDMWKLHLKGARVMIQLSGVMKLKSSISTSLSVLITHLAVIDIMGKSLSFSATNNDVLAWGESPEEVFASLGETERYSILGCPTELLQLIALVSQLRNRPCKSTCTPPTLPRPPDDHSLLISRIASFSPQRWIQAVLPSLCCSDPGGSGGSTPPPFDISELYHHVSAYKSAVQIFALQVLSCPIPDTTAYDALIEGLLCHIAEIQPGSVFLKGAVWPIFVAGAAATAPRQRAFVKKALDEVWKVLPQDNIRSAAALLETIWNDDRGGGWVERIARAGGDYLFI